MKYFARFCALVCCATIFQLGCSAPKTAKRPAPKRVPTAISHHDYTSPVRQLLRKVPRKREQPIALRSLSKLLKAHPGAEVVTVVWLNTKKRREALLNTMSLDRAQGFLLIEWADGCSRAIPALDNSVHHFADIGRIDSFGTSECL